MSGERRTLALSRRGRGILGSRSGWLGARLLTVAQLEDASLLWELVLSQELYLPPLNPEHPLLEIYARLVCF